MSPEIKMCSHTRFHFDNELPNPNCHLCLQEGLDAATELIRELRDNADNFACAMAPNFSDEEKKERWERLSKAIEKASAYLNGKEAKT